MSEIKLSQLPEATASTPQDYFMVVQNGVNKKIRLSYLLSTLDSSDNIKINPKQAAINLRVSSVNSLNLLFINGVSDFIGIDTDNPLAKFHVNGDIKIGSSSANGVLINSDEEILYTLSGDAPQGVGFFKTLNVSREISTLRVEDGVSSGQFSLGIGLPGQYKLLTVSQVQLSSKASIRVLSGLGFNRIDISTVGNSVVLRCVSINGASRWVCVANYLTTVYTI